jgi:hypothetical protein
VLQGGVGALVAIAMLWGGFLAVQGAWGDSLTALLEGDRLAFLPPRLLLALVTGGMGVGGLGGSSPRRHAGSTATPEPGGEPGGQSLSRRFGRPGHCKEYQLLVRSQARRALDVSSRRRSTW